MQKSITWAVLAVVILIGGWLLYKAEISTTSSQNPIKIGAILSETGSAASYGEVAKNGIQLAVDDINKNGGINGRQVEVSIEDDQTDPKEAVSAFQKLVGIDHVDGIVGGLFDFTTKPLFPLAESSQTAFISPINFYIPGGFELTDHTFVMLPSFSSVITQLSGYLAQHGTKRLAVVHFKSTFGQEIADTLSSVMAGMGKGPIVDEAYDQIGNNDFSTTILKLKQDNVDTVFLDMVDVDPVTFLTRANELNYHPTIISYSGLIDSFAGSDKDKSLIEGAIILDWEFSPASFAVEYQAKYGVTPSKSADKSYAAVYVLAQAIAKSANHDAVAPYIASTSFSTPVGTVQFNDKHAVDSTPVRIEIVKNDTLTPLQ